MKIFKSCKLPIDQLQNFFDKGEPNPLVVKVPSPSALEALQLQNQIVHEENALLSGHITKLADYCEQLLPLITELHNDEREDIEVAIAKARLNVAFSAVVQEVEEEENNGA